jgi:hypothetical protein
MIFPCGFASVRFPRKANRYDPFVKWLLAEGIAKTMIAQNAIIFGWI